MTIDLEWGASFFLFQGFMFEAMIGNASIYVVLFGLENSFVFLMQPIANFIPLDALKIPEQLNNLNLQTLFVKK